MKQDDFFYTENISKVPDIFYNSQTGTPHEYCFNCNTYLLESGTLYIVEKAFRDGIVVFDYALCLDCQEKMWKEMISKESEERIMAYFDKKLDLERRMHDFAKRHKNNIQEWLKYCLLTGKPIAESREYQIYGQFDGDILPYLIMPYAISDEGIEEIIPILSKKTKENLEDFMEQLNPSPFLVKPFDSGRLPVLF